MRWISPDGVARTWRRVGSEPVPVQPVEQVVMSPPQAQSMLFNEDGQVYTLTVGYCMDKRIGNTEGLGGVFAFLKAVGSPLPVAEAQRLYTPSLRFEIRTHLPFDSVDWQVIHQGDCRQERAVGRR